ncbi:CHAT domain-containing protein [Cercophora samala]|uniref:CHAT domain-containing protein n=1 Tax=Cercophora samala TaxID=330535 RepID=A0AA39Z911_9PEZI|nr:CHAT domain-containing protein [Cercophora samala]
MLPLGLGSFIRNHTSQQDSGVAKYKSFCTTRTVECLNEAIRLTKEAVRLFPKSHKAYPDALSNLSTFHRERYIFTGVIGDLTDAVKTAQDAVTITPEGDRDRPGRLTNLSNALEQRFTTNRNMEDLDRAIALSREAVATTEDGDADLPIMLNNLAKQLGEAHVQGNGNATLLDEAIEALSQAIGLTPCDHLGHKGIMLGNLGVRLHDRYLMKGTEPDLDESIRVTRQALTLLPPDHKDRLGIAAELSNRLGARYATTRVEQDLDNAIDLARKALQATNPGHQSHPMILANLANRLREKYARTKNVEEYLKPAISYTETAIDLTKADHTHLARRLSTLASLLYDLYLAKPMESVTNPNGQTDIKIASLERAISYARQAIDLTEPNHSHYAGRAQDLSQLLSAAGPEHLDEAIQWAEIAVENTSEGHSERAAWLVALASQLVERVVGYQSEALEHLQLGKYSDAARYDVARAKEYLLEAVSDNACNVGTRMKAGRCLMINADTFFLRHGEGEKAYAIAQDMIKSISLIAPRHFQNDDKQHILDSAVGLASEAAAIALATGKDPVHALQSLEEGRGVILGSLYDLRSNIEAVECEHPDLASKFKDLRNKLNAPSPQINDSSAMDMDRFRENEWQQAHADRRRETGRLMEEVINTIRSQPGFDRFLLPPSSSDLIGAAAEGPVVVLNVSYLRCDALIVRPSGIQSLPLDRINYYDVKAKAEALGPEMDSVSMLEWLWDRIVGPVFDFLGFTTMPSDGQWPRVWWVPTGRLVNFPLHAAGHHLETGFRNALDRAISSYSPSIKSIIHSRQRKNAGQDKNSAPSDDRDLVLLTMQHTPDLPGRGYLAHAARETAAVGQLANEMSLSCSSPDCTKPKVLKALENCRILHFAGHGSADSSVPLKSHLLLSDWKTSPLTVQSLLDLDLAARPPFLAYLSACQSGQVANDNSVDESIHLSSAFQLAGFRHVIGTLWEVNDRVCVDMAQLVYEGLKRDGFTDAALSAALHHATRRLRDDWVRNPQPAGQTADTVRPAELWHPEDKACVAHWVPYVHYGV